MCVTTYCVHSQDDEDPLNINAVSDAVKRHPNLVEVTVGYGCSVSPFGVLKGVLQKEDVRKVDVIKSRFTIGRSILKLSSKCECLRICAVSAVCSRVFTCSLCVYLYSALMDDLVQEYLIPAMKRGSLKAMGVWLKKSSNVESILRELPQSKIEELAIKMVHYKHYHYSHYYQEVSLLCVYVCVLLLFVLTHSLDLFLLHLNHNA